MARFWKVMWTWAMLGMLTLAFGAIGNVALVVGEANILRANTTLVVENGMALEEKDILTTAKNAKVQLRFSDDTIISLGSEAEFSIDTFINDDTAPKAKFGIARGSFGAITGKIGKIAPQDFALQTKTATIGIRGTHIRGRTGPTGDMVSCLRGSISVTSLSTGQSVAVLAGQITRIAPGMAPEPPRNIEPGDMEAMGDAPGDEGGQEGEGDAPDANEGAGEEGGTAPQDQEGDTPMMEVALQNITPETAQDAINTALDVVASEKYETTSDIVSFTGWSTCDTAIGCVVKLDINRLTAAMTGGITGTTSGEYVNLNISGTSQTEEDFSEELHLDLGYDMGIWEHATEGVRNVSGEYSDAIYITDYLFSRNGFSITETMNSELMTIFYGNSEFTALPASDEIKSTLDEYVAWGYWMADYSEESFTDEAEFFAIGKDADLAAQYVANNTGTHTYNGTIAGIMNTKEIDSLNSSIGLTFDFGDPSAFTGTLEIVGRNLSDTGSLTMVIGVEGASWTAAAGFEGTSNVPESIPGSIRGGFYGNEAQAVGGTFQFDDGTNNAKGVFKAVR